MAGPLDSMMLSGGFNPDQVQQMKMPIDINYQATGPAAVPYINQAMENYQGAQDRSFRASDTANAYNQFLTEQAKAAEPFMAGQRKLGETQTALQQSTYDSGQQKQLYEAVLGSQHKEALAKMSAAELADQDTRNQAFIRAKAAVDADPSPGKTQGWKLGKEYLTNAGVKNVPDTFDDHAHALVTAGAAMAVQLAPHVQEMQKLQLQTGSAQKIAETQAGATVTAAGISANAQMFASQQGLGPREARAYDAISSGSAGLGDMAIIRNATIRAIGAGAYQNMGLKLLDMDINSITKAITETSDPKKQAALEDQRKKLLDAYKEQLDRAMGMPNAANPQAAAPPVSGGAPTPAPNPVAAGKPIHGTYKGVPGTYDPTTKKWTPD